MRELLKKNKIFCEIWDKRNNIINALPYLKKWIVCDIHKTVKYICYDLLNKKEYPRELQLPITYQCNFDCIMCGMKKNRSKKHISLEQLKSILENPIFRNIRSVGVNGGEPFLRRDIEECIEILCDCLPRLNSIAIISNGYFTEIICEKLEKIKKICEKSEIKLVFSVSVDGIGDMQDYMRGRTGAFEHVEQTVKKILLNRENYCDSFQAICTVTSKNIYRINEVEVWSKKIGVPVSYNVATESKRLDNEERIPNFSIFEDEEIRLLVAEFFLKKYSDTKEEKYWALYYLIFYGKRVSECTYCSGQGITIVPSGKIAYCATHSKELCNALEQNAEEVFFENKTYLREIKERHCGKCSQYSYQLNRDGYKKIFLKYLKGDWK